jgi:exonuclease SbcC
MKILLLRFKNLNSLQGEWSIDFTCPEYVSDGIFAITGPTGSGKSTILDAICLALYGQTPRLGKITKSSNELMSRHTGECFAEVTFSTSSGSYRCHWSQHRSRRRSDGDLQAQKHEISDVATGQPIHSRVQETLQAIEGLTGMDFDRFTRSMLLAQGGFAAFLQAEPDRRAPVLEQITGTAIYSTISMRVHERQRSERSRLELLQADSDSVRLLGEEELNQLASDRNRCLDRERELSGQADEASAALRWLQEIARLEEALAAIDREASALIAEREAFLPDAIRLALARNASAIEHRYAPLSMQRGDHQRSLSDLSSRESLRPAKQAAMSEAEFRYESVDGRLRSALEESAVVRPLIEQVRLLDARISEKLRACDIRTQELEELSNRHQQLESDRKVSAGAIEAAIAALRDLRAWQESHCVDADLLIGLSGIQHALDELQPVARREALLVSGASDTRRAIQDLLDEKSALEQDAVVSRSKLAEARKALALLRDSYTSQLDGSTLRSLRMELDALKERRRILEEIAALYASGKELAPKIAEIDSGIHNIEDKRLKTEVRLEHARQLLAMAEREVVVQEERLRLAARVRDLEAERHRLADGQPCPLCGSIHHPYAVEAGSLPDADDRDLQKAKQSVQEQSEGLRNLEIVLAECGKEIEQKEQRRDELADMREKSGRRCLELLRTAGIPDHARDAEPVVLAGIGDAECRHAELAGRIENLETLTERMGVDEAALLLLQDAANVDERRLEQSDERIRTLQLELQRLEQEKEAAKMELDVRQKSLYRLLEPYGADMDISAPDTFVQTLAARSARWQSEVDRCRNLDQSLISHEAALKNIDAQLETLEKDLASKRTVVSAAAAAIDTDRGERNRLFEDKDPAVEEQRLEGIVKTAREELDAAGDERARARQEIVVLNTGIDELQKVIDGRRDLLDGLEAGFAVELQQKGFTDESAFLDARLPDPERDRIEQVSAGLERRALDIESRRSDRVSRLREARDRRLTELTSDELAGRHEQLQETLRAVRGEIGAIVRQVEENERAAGEQRQKAAVIEAQKSECRRWDILHDLIGSADGKKYRNFAQGITFEIMIAHANRQLVRMTDRYILVRDRAEPLELSVIDQWQAGEVRSTRNLSGGESFIVSLALALGLSQMSSRNVRVDSLFLDEGFGTLDEEALETALETLSGLQQSGKLIGIISHVPALKERIATQIRVFPLSGGRSAITGPGVCNPS